MPTTKILGSNEEVVTAEKNRAGKVAMSTVADSNLPDDFQILLAANVAEILQELKKTNAYLAEYLGDSFKEETL